MAKSKNSYVNKTAKYNVYLSGRRLIGLADSIDMPDINIKTEDSEVAGGTFSVPIVGQFEATDITIPFQQMYGQIYDFIAMGEMVDLTFRIANETLTGDGNITAVGSRIVVRGMPKTISPGSYKNGTSTNASVALSLSYIYFEEDGSPKFEVDYLNGVFRQNGRDMNAAIDALI